MFGVITFELKGHEVMREVICYFLIRSLYFYHMIKLFLLDK